MNKEKTFSHLRLLSISTVALLLIMTAFVVHAYADEGGQLATGVAKLQAQENQDPIPYTYDATLYNAEYPGVYKATVNPNTAATQDEAATIGIPSINDTTLAEHPTTESPAIICGSAVNWYQEEGTKAEIEAAGKENARKFTAVSPDRVAPYSYFRFGVMEQTGTDGVTRPKLSGFDGTYVIVRIDVSELVNSVPEDQRDTSYLHISQDKNKALLVAVGMDATGQKGSQDTDVTKKERDQWGNVSFCNLFAVTDAQGQASGTQYNKKTASYKLTELCDSNGADTETPYFDVILFSTASIVSGADAQKQDAINGDVELSFYIDDTPDYNRAVNWDPQSQDTTLADKCFKKFYDEEKAQAANAPISRYKVKGSELHLETMVENSDGDLEGGDGTHTTYWSLEKSIEHTYYDQPIDKDKADPNCGRTVKLMSEVPVIDNFALKGASETELRKRTLDVNSFDIQVANNTSPAEGEYTSGLWLENAWLKIADLSNTTGAELAIGNNATMTIEKGGKLIVDRTCQLEIEWDGATTQPAAEGQTATAQTDVLNNGSLDLHAGGEVQNDGVITIEGTEGKPYQPNADGTPSTAPESEKGHGELTICAGATFTNNGCFMPNGALYVQGNLINNGKYNDDPITSEDPDRGLFTYHRGIQCTWKDDVTQQNVIYGGMYVGMDKEWSKTYPDAVVTNNGDIILCPGELINQATIKNMPDGGIYLCATDRAIIPIEPDPATPTITTKEVDLAEPAGSRIMNWGAIDNQGEIRPAQLSVATNGSLNKLILPGNYDDMFSLTCWEQGKLTGVGYVYKQKLKTAAVEFIADGEVIDSAIYDGSAQTFGMLVTAGDGVNPGTNDFTVTYLDSAGATITKDQIKDAGTYQVKIQGQNAFTGINTKEFIVTPAPLTELTLNETSFRYDETEHKATAKSVKAGDLELTSSDYTLSYSSDSPVGVGAYSAIATGTGNFTGEASANFEIVQISANWTRLAGNTRYDTMATIVKEGFDASQYAVVATGKNFPDALAASALAGAYGCPVVLTDPSALSPQAGSTLKELGVEQVFIMGGTAALSADVENAIKDMGITVTRLSGNTRQSTAIAALQQVKSKKETVQTVIVTTGYNYPDSLSISPWSYANSAPIVLTESNGTLSEATLEAVRSAGATSAIIVGGTKAVASTVEDQLRSAGATSVTRLEGKTRYATSLAVAEYAATNGMGYANPAVATGEKFPDALVGAALAGKKGSVLLLAANQKSPTVALLESEKYKIDDGYFLGGEGAVSKDLADYIIEATK